MWYIRLYYKNGTVIDVTFSRRKDAQAAVEGLNAQLQGIYYTKHPEDPWYGLSQYNNTADLVNMNELLHVAFDSNQKLDHEP